MGKVNFPREDTSSVSKTGKFPPYYFSHRLMMLHPASLLPSPMSVTASYDVMSRASVSHSRVTYSPVILSTQPEHLAVACHYCKLSVHICVVQITLNAKTRHLPFKYICRPESILGSFQLQLPGIPHK
ncbi:hypothetical protein E2C01_020467 [Portunus trituberculatus]|uniref:Uncharacterized protein n=1 Tax=Portunus trituberculatus TaxID=210409 RepID=A0A5B7E1K3_PORTR|nr:hypothetical protein [Portunus trituberculatus]